jgi:hypothetical protein
VQILKLKLTKEGGGIMVLKLLEVYGEGRNKWAITSCSDCLLVRATTYRRFREKEGCLFCSGSLERKRVSRAPFAGMIVCAVCHQDKPVEDFVKVASRPGGYSGMCKSCNLVHVSKFKLEKPEERKASEKRYRESHREKKLKQDREYYRNNKDKRTEYVKDYYAKNADHVKEYQKSYREMHRENGSVKSYMFYARGLTSQVIRNEHHSNASAEALLGIDASSARAYLFHMFELNYGYPLLTLTKCFELDHIIPLSNATTFEEIKRLSHYTNLQILTKEDNKKKGTLHGNSILNFN